MPEYSQQKIERDWTKRGVHDLETGVSRIGDKSRKEISNRAHRISKYVPSHPAF
jgi:hypothetical protein